MFMVLISGCMTLPQKIGQDDVEFIRGSVVSDKGQFYMTPCFSQERRLLVDSAGYLARRYKDQSPNSDLPVYMELRAYQKVDLSWDVRQIDLAGGGSQACSYDMTGVTLRAAGTDPLWIADVTDEGVRIQSYYELRTLTFPFGEIAGNNGIWEGDLGSIKGREHSYRLTVTDQSCRDKLNAWYSKTARLELDGDVFFGCARDGNLTEKAIQGRYSTVLDDQKVFVVLDVLAEQRVSMLLDYRNGQPLIVLKGQWRWNENGKLILDFVEVDGRQQHTILVMSRKSDGGLKQEGFSEEFGREGLELQRSE